jgi:hypothetical protein
MFVQVIRGQVTDPEQVQAALDRWSLQLAAGAATRTERGSSWRKTLTSGPRSALTSSAA